MSQPTIPGANRLSGATSPYLLQHAHNPVDWHEWSDEALRLARTSGRPIFLSIGYSACHWCHVMAHESFEDPQIAAVMNRLFVNIKVDREERPDLDEIYMQATMILNQGHGGWPMSVWLTPDLKPFFAGTYFPPRAKWGRPGFVELCERIGEVWRTNRAALESDANRLTDVIDQSLRGGSDARDESRMGAGLALVDRAVDALSNAFDAERGGLASGSNKFPPSMTLDLFLRAVLRRGAQNASSRGLLQLARVTLDGMAHGGIYDHLAGGICRYSTDPEWHVPHFEKMLYDQALVSQAYVNGWLVMKEPLYRRVATEIFDYVLGDLRSPEGAFFSARDADSEGEEGRYYVWTKAEILEILGGADGELFCGYYDVSDDGNWSDPHAPGVRKNVLRVRRAVEDVAGEQGLTTAEVQRRLSAGRARLLAARQRRTPPGRDDKILVEWNGLMIASLARGGAALAEPKYVAAAAAAADFILREQREAGRLWRAWRQGRSLKTAFLSDYSCLVEGLLELYEATFEQRWLSEAIALNETAAELFWDEAGGGFFFTPADHEPLITRSKDVRDGAAPSGASVQLMNLLRLSAMTGRVDWREKADRMIAAAGPLSPGASERFLAGVEFAEVGPVEIALIGAASDPGMRLLGEAVHECYLPNRVLVQADPATAPGPLAGSPLLEGRGLVDGRATAYVCRQGACRPPATSREALIRELEAALSP